ncbi:uncharacterized protein CEXT_489331 [Caerostris extrusa]|uniref:Uncharacterized protein n=1 Tax=Caerostris extrusa TaxID=172846 RepID=A0AAV4MNW2_CAEEX|nr:uncharacterized protein CEXT_489331 [Caerostris extrusa]
MYAVNVCACDVVVECSAIIQQLVRVLPESPQWLLARGRFEETIRLVRTIASNNGRDLTPDFIVATKKLTGG